MLLISMLPLDKPCIVLVDTVSVFDVERKHTVLPAANMFVLGTKSLVMNQKQIIGSMQTPKFVQNASRI